MNNKSKIGQATNIFQEAIDLDTTSNTTSAISKYEEGVQIASNVIDRKNPNGTFKYSQNYRDRWLEKIQQYENRIEDLKLVERLNNLLPSIPTSVSGIPPLKCKYSSDRRLRLQVAKKLTLIQQEEFRRLKDDITTKLINFKKQRQEHKIEMYTELKKIAAKLFLEAQKNPTIAAYLESSKAYDKAYDYLYKRTIVSSIDTIDWLYQSEYELLLSKVKRCFVDFLKNLDVSTLGEDVSEKNKQLIQSTLTHYTQSITAGILLADYFLTNNDDGIIRKFGEWCTTKPDCDFSSDNGGTELSRKCRTPPSPINRAEHRILSDEPELAAARAAPVAAQVEGEAMLAVGGKKKKNKYIKRKKITVKKVGVYRSKGGYYFRRYKNGNVKRISKEIYKKLK
jgi:hypothetical protein